MRAVPARLLEVQFEGSGTTACLTESALELCDKNEDPIDLLLSGSLVTHEDLVKGMALLKLKYQPADHLFSHNAAHITPYQWQFKQVLKWLEADRPRIASIPRFKCEQSLLTRAWATKPRAFPNPFRSHSEWTKEWGQVTQDRRDRIVTTTVSYPCDTC